jgi:hypothetical protein
MEPAIPTALLIRGNQIYKMLEMYEDRMAIMVCDFAPLKVREYDAERESAFLSYP